MNKLPPPTIHPPRGQLPVLLSVPHSGRDYPDWLIGLAAAGKPSLTTLEDPFVDRLVWRALQRGCGAVISRTPRAAVALQSGRAAPEAKMLSKPFHLKDLVAEVDRIFQTEDQHGRL